ncbi:uncharacterized protein PAC_11513 [Phialocephala subalpina]|uniref:HCP-like protein n=1 Tax=Phialocephala subalpina TaxID=576137 RepID=A0A1L7X9E9_9HELO|nr:uncharacterized protein PAC_11513 [Phialocephala subalpina]
MYKLESRTTSACISLVARNACRHTRCFHATSIPKARPAPKPSPKVRAKLGPQPGVIRIKKTPAIEDSLPPLVLLESGRKSGVLRIEPEAALEFLRQYMQSTTKPSGTWEQKLCDEHDVDPGTLSVIGGILRRSQSKAQLILAKKVMLTASALGDKPATLEIVSEALRTGKLDDYTAPLQQLGLLAKKDNDPQALTLLGKVYYVRRSNKEALECFRKATRPPTGSLDFDGAGDALVFEGQILLASNDKDGAKAAFEKAAKELDEPAAYFYLSKLQEPGSSQEQVYLLKAASSGITEAWHNLGALELAKQKGSRTKKSATLADFGMASEWFQVAAADGFGLSMLNLALMCKSVGKIEEGMKWLEKAEENVEVRDQARAIKSQFHNDKVGAI